jgi:hypothetical protein
MRERHLEVYEVVKQCETGDGAEADDDIIQLEMNDEARQLMLPSGGSGLRKLPKIYKRKPILVDLEEGTRTYFSRCQLRNLLLSDPASM